MKRVLGPLGVFLVIGTIFCLLLSCPPTSGCKSMMEGLTIMRRVFINLLYTHTMPNNHYCSTYMMAYPHLMAKHCLIVGRNSWFFPDLRHETHQQVAVKVWWKDLQSCVECSSTCYTPIQCQTTTIAAPTWWHIPSWWPNVPQRSSWLISEIFPIDLRHIGTVLSSSPLVSL